MSSALALEAGGRGEVRAIRAWWREVRPPPSLLKRLEPVYYVAIVLAILGPLVYGTASSALADVATPDAVAKWATSLALLGLLVVVRWGAVQGPVVFSLADVAQLLGAPLRRTELVIGRLARGLLWGAGGGAIIGALALVGVAGHGRGIPVDRAAGFVGAVMLLGLLGVAGASLVQGSRRFDRLTRVAAWPCVALAVALVAVSSAGSAGRHVALWSGPWGWAVQPLSVGSLWPVAVALLLVVTCLAVVLAVARCGRCPTERHLLRAEARGGAVAAIYSLNARYVGRSMAAVNASAVAGGATRLRTPRSPRLAVAWRDAEAARGTPQRLFQALALAAGGAAVCLLDARHPVAVAAGAFAIYAAASLLLEPLRSEIDTPSRARVLLLAPLARVLAEHAIVPALAILVATVVAAAGCAAAGELPAHGGAAALLLVAATPAITLCAALSSRRGGQLPASLLSIATTDASGIGGSGIVLGWIVLWPALAVALATWPVSAVVRHGAGSAPGLLVLLAGAAVALLVALSRERFAP